MTFFTTLARVLAGTHLVALPALLVYYYFCAERFIRNIHRFSGMAIRTYIGLLFDLPRFFMAYLALDPGRLEIVRMGGIQFLGIDLMVTLNTFDRKILCVHLMVKYHFTDRRGKSSLRWYRHGV